MSLINPVAPEFLSTGKDYALVHAAPVVAVFVLDHTGVPVPSPYEVENRVVPSPDMHSPHFALICTQEQIKVHTCMYIYMYICTYHVYTLYIVHAYMYIVHAYVYTYIHVYTKYTYMYVHIM